MLEYIYTRVALFVLEFPISAARQHGLFWILLVLQGVGAVWLFVLRESEEGHREGQAQGGGGAGEGRARRRGGGRRRIGYGCAARTPEC